MSILFVCSVLPVLLVTWILSIPAKQRLQADMERLLREMDFDEVEHRVQSVSRHAMLFGGHLLVFMLAYWLFDDIGIRLVWMYGLLIHALSLWLYHIRWNIHTLDRKRKIDMDTLLEAEVSLAFDPSAQYQLGADGEFVRVEKENLS